MKEEREIKNLNPFNKKHKGKKLRKWKNNRFITGNKKAGITLCISVITVNVNELNLLRE